MDFNFSPTFPSFPRSPRRARSFDFVQGRLSVTPSKGIAISIRELPTTKDQEHRSTPKTRRPKTAFLTADDSFPYTVPSHEISHYRHRRTYRSWKDGSGEGPHRHRRGSPGRGEAARDHDRHRFRASGAGRAERRKAAARLRRCSRTRTLCA